MNTPRHPAATAQIAAADPRRNVWLVANAGSGKTRVLTDRVARLLLRGVDPQNILCLTYTKAAAAEMQNRLFRRLGTWAMATDADLRANLEELGEPPDLPEAGLRRARQLFARAIETPGGIRIQTIHSFCAGLLRRFPLEAGVSPSFVELDDRSAALLRQEVLEEMAEGEDRPLLDAILPDVSEAKLDGILAGIAGKRQDFARVPPDARIRAALGLPEGLDDAALLDRAFAPGDMIFLGAVRQVLATATGKTDPKAAVTLSQVRAPDLAGLEVLEGVFLTKTGENAGLAKLDSFPTKATRAALGPLLDPLQGLMQRVESARPLRLGLSAFRRARALHRFAAAFLRRYEAAKSARGFLDFDDFILRATALLTDRGVAPWVLYRLDGAIDHILVDEAQDTSPAQWQIVEALTEEFTAGLGARAGVARSLFVVGDRKQSIYSFQGADVAGFDKVRRRFAEAFAGAEQPVQEGELKYSFRSSPAILSLVDACFPGDLATALGGAFSHAAFFDGMPGRVDIWPAILPPEKPEPGVWYDPVDMVAETDAVVVLARKVAAAIRAMLDSGAQVPDDARKGTFRPVRPGDVLILVQRRKELFAEIIRACKAEGLPIAGADRLTLTEELAVRDILALLAFLNTPEDDLSLATVLRSPLFGWSEGALHRLAQPRPGYLWEALRKAGGPEVDVLQDLLGQAEFLRPFELIDRMLTRHGGRARLLGRMGVEAADALDELMAQALAYERTEVPSLTGFLVWMAAGEVQVKRQAEGEGAVIRVMTVHGAKGLEAPVVILPETADRRLEDRDPTLPLAPGVATWMGRKDDDPPAASARKAARAADREAENLRLLYVAMTRAKSWLIVAAAGKWKDTSWYGLIRKGAESLGFSADAEGGMTFASAHWPAPSGAPSALPAAATAAAAVLPALPALIPAPQPRAASDLGGEKVLPGDPVVEVEGDPLARGTVLHRLLELLPGRKGEEWQGLATRLGATADVLEEAAGVLRDPAFGWLFAPGTLAEVEVALPLPGGPIAGTIDRLVVEPDRVVVVDYKSNAVVPATAAEVPEGYLRQLGAYAAAMASVYPERRVEVAILWTKGPLLMPLDPEIVRVALDRAAIP